MFLNFKQHHDDKYPKKKYKQKEFVLEMVSVLMKKAENARQNLHFPPLFIDPISFDFSSPLINTNSQSSSVSAYISNSRVCANTRSSRTSSNGPASKKVPKSLKNNDGISLNSFTQRTHLPISLHHRSTTGNKCSRCVYCSLKFQEQDEDGRGALNWDKMVSRTQSKCIYCGVFLCRKHFDCFHSDF